MTKLKTVIVIGLVCFVTHTVYGEDYFQGISCEQDISTIKDLQPVYMNTVMTMTWYEKKDQDRIVLGEVETDRINYIFWDNKFYGKFIAIYGAENITEVLRFFQNRYGAPITNVRTRTTLWSTDDYVFRATRFSYHLAQFDILCRSMFFTVETPEEQSQAPSK